MLFDEYSQCADALGNDQVDVVTTDNVILLGFVSESDGAFKLVGEQFTEEPYGIGITKGDVEFCEFINETLAAGTRRPLPGGLGLHRRQIEGTQTPELPEPDEPAADLSTRGGRSSQGPAPPPGSARGDRASSTPPLHRTTRPTTDQEEHRVESVTENFGLFVVGVPRLARRSS